MVYELEYNEMSHHHSITFSLWGREWITCVRASTMVYELEYNEMSHHHSITFSSTTLLPTMVYSHYILYSTHNHITTFF
ncbi:hypothetical protein Scep_027655 [Stephania cephalantha]|uniref:Uncharacterized protein n=1 Tax=Stephania cephalantha TaxID=152367 RepID=A0AAP0HHF5_9MAGN